MMAEFTSFLVAMTLNSPKNSPGLSAIYKDYPEDFSFSDDTIASTRSLLTPLYASSSSHGSTESLSAESLSLLSLSESAKEDSPSPIKATPKKGSQHVKASTPLAWNGHHKNRSHVKPGSRSDTPTNANQTAWEQWMVQKAFINCSELERIKNFKRQKKLQEHFTEQEKASTKLLCQTKRKEWLAKKTFEQRKQKQEVEAQEAYEMQKKKQEREMIQERSKEKYLEWLEKKRQQKITAEFQHRETQSSKHHLLEIKNRENKQAYEKWLEKASHKPKRILNSFAISDGRLKGYYDGTSVPLPTYINPIPWESPRTETETETETRPSSLRKGTFESPPLLWRDVRNRQRQRKHVKSIKHKTCH